MDMHDHAKIAWLIVQTSNFLAAFSIVHNHEDMHGSHVGSFSFDFHLISTFLNLILANSWAVVTSYKINKTK